MSDTQTVTVTILDINDAPTITTNSSASTFAITLSETATAVATFAGSDVDAGATLSWSISGTDAADLVINPSTGALSFITKPDYESPSDSDGNNTYIVTVTLSDGLLTDIQTVTITISNVNEAPIITTNNSDPTFALTLSEGITKVATFNGIDQDAGASLSWTISGTDAADFTINASNGALAFGIAPNYRAPADSDTNNTYIVIVTLSDGSLSDSQTVTITIDDLNDAPTITTNSSDSTYSIAHPEGQLSVINYAGSDVDANTTLTWSISCTDAGLFTINSSSGALSFVTAPDYDAPADSNADNTYIIKVTLSDGRLTDTQLLSVLVTNLSDLSGYFDGNTVLTTTDGASFNRPQTSFTIEAWIKADVAACSIQQGKICVILDKPNQYQLSLKYFAALGGVFACFTMKNFNTTYDIRSIGWATDLYCWPTAKIRTDSWNHLMVSVRRGSGYGEPNISLFFNGFAVYQYGGNMLSSVLDTVTATSPLTIGGEASNSANNFVGQIDQVRISGTAAVMPWTANGRNTRFFTQRLNEYQPNDNGNLIAHYDFNEESGNAVLNRAPNAGSGTNLSIAQGSLVRRSVASVSISGNYTIYTFPRTYLTASGGWKTPTGVSKVSALIVGGGGAGGSQTETGQDQGGGGGGGAGEYRYISSLSVSDTMSVVVGLGGTPALISDFYNSGDGGLSQFGDSSTAIAAGGGAGGCD
jgi:hypothetical protein